MGKRVKEIDTETKEFIESQKLFFVGTAANEGKINVSPKGMDSFRILSEIRVVWLNLTGSGNETAAHLAENSRTTVMFCAFEEKPLILRIYGKAKVYHKQDKEWNDLISLFPEMPGARQLIDIEIDLVQHSCGFGVPLMEFESQRDILSKWATKKGEKGIEEYQKEKNTVSLDGNIIKGLI